MYDRSYCILFLLEKNFDYFKQHLPWMDYKNLKKQSKESLKIRIFNTVNNGNFPTWFAIIYKDNFCGMIGFNEIDNKNNIGEIGYFIGEEYSSKGIMTLALDFIIKYSFNELSLHKIELYIAENNIASLKLAKKYFYREGIIRKSIKFRDQYFDEHIYGLLRNEYSICFLK